MNNMNAIRWVFFDIGSTLVDEEEAYNHRIRDMIRGTSIIFEQFSEKRIQYAKAGYNGDQKCSVFVLYLCAEVICFGAFLFQPFFKINYAAV